MDLDTLKYYGELVLLGLGALTVGVNAIALVTPSDKDNKVGKVLSAINEKLQLFVLPFLKNRKPKV
jgi:histidinol dehydrogenase